MQSRGEETVRMRMVEMRLICEREIPIQQERIDSVHYSFQKSLFSAKSKSQETLESQVREGNVKAELREAEADLVKALAGKTRKEAKKMATMDALSAIKTKVDELKGVVGDQKARKDECAAILSQQSLDLTELEAKHRQNVQCREEIEEAIAWYNRVLGFRIECGHGVKFIFMNINPKDPSEEYSFTIWHENDTYTLLGCDPVLSGTNELMKELNISNGLFRFVRTMRQKFQDAATTVSTDNRSESPAEHNKLQPVDLNRISQKVNLRKEARLAKLSPGSIRRSPRLKAK